MWQTTVEKSCLGSCMEKAPYLGVNSGVVHSGEVRGVDPRQTSPAMSSGW